MKSQGLHEPPPASRDPRGRAVRGKELPSAPGAEGQGSSFALCTPPLSSRVRVCALIPAPSHPCLPDSLAPPDAWVLLGPQNPSFPSLLCYPSKIFSSGLRCRCPDGLGSLCPPRPQCLLPSVTFCLVPPNPSLPRNLVTWESSLLAPESGAHPSSSTLLTLL